MYAWRENVKTKKEGKKEIKTYSYEKEWTSMPQDSSGFHITEGHVNTPMRVKDESFKVSQANVGSLAIDVANARFYSLSPLPLKKAQVVQAYLGQKTSLSGDGSYLFLPTARASTQKQATNALMELAQAQAQNPPASDPATNPSVGDLRLSYQHYAGQKQGTVVGDWNGSQITPHIFKETKTFLGIYPGSAALFAATLHKQHKITTWIIRIASFVMLWFGMNLILGPLLVILGAIPILGELGKGMISLVTGAIALVLWLLTLFLANFWLILLIVLVLGIGLLIYSKKKSATQAPPEAV